MGSIAVNLKDIKFNTFTCRDKNFIKGKSSLNPQKAHLHDMKQQCAKFDEDKSSSLRVCMKI